MYALGGASAFAGFAVAADATGLFQKLGLAGPLIAALNTAVVILLALWVVAFAYALVVITARRLGRGPAVVPAPARVRLAPRSVR